MGIYERVLVSLSALSHHLSSRRESFWGENGPWPCPFELCLPWEMFPTAQTTMAEDFNTKCTGPYIVK